MNCVDPTFATRHYAMSGALDEIFEDNVSKSDSSDDNLDAVRKVNEFDIRSFRNTMDVDSNFLVGNSVGGTPVDTRCYLSCCVR